MLGIERDDEGKVIEGKGDQNAQTKYRQVGIIKEAIDQTTDLKRRIDGGEDAKVLQPQIDALQQKIDKAKGVISNIGKGKDLVRITKAGTPIYKDRDADPEMSSSFYTDEGFSQASAERMANSNSYTATSRSSIIAQVRNEQADFTLSDREAMDIYNDGLWKRYLSLQREASDKKIKVNLFNFGDDRIDYEKIYLNEDGSLKETAKRAGLTLEDVNSFVNAGEKGQHAIRMSDTFEKLSTLPGWNADEGVGEFTYSQLHKLGLTSRRTDNFFDILGGAISREDKEWMEIHDSMLDDNEGARRAMFKIHDLDIDPASIEKPGFLESVYNTSFKAFGTHFLNHTEAEADEKFSQLHGSSKNTNRFVLDQISELQSEYNRQNKKAIEKGIVQPLMFTKEQSDQLGRTYSENISEGVGHFMPMLVELAAITAVTNATGAPMALANMARGLKVAADGRKVFMAGNTYQKMMGHLGGAVLEEAKMRVAGFKAGSGVSFYAGGALMRPFLNPLQGGRFAWLDNAYQKTIKAGPVGAISMEGASIVELAWEDFMDVKDFGSEFKDMYGSFDDVAQRMIVNSFVFGLVGATHLRKTDLMSTGAKQRTIESLHAKIKELNDKPNLTSSEKAKLEGYRSTQKTLAHMFMLEEQAHQLNTKSENFEANFEKRYTKPFQKIIQEAIGKNNKGEYLWKGYDVRFTDSEKSFGLFQNQQNFDKLTAPPAKYIKGGGKDGKDLVVFDKARYGKEGYVGKEIHELIGHAAFEAITSGPNGKALEINFQGRMANMFHKYDKQLGKTLTKGLDKVPPSLKKIIDLLEQGKGNEIKDREYLAYMLEAFSNPNTYYELYATSAVKEGIANFTSFFEEFIPGYKPKIKTAEDFVGYIARLTRDIRLDVPYANKLTRFVADNPLKDLKLNEIDLLSIDISQNPRRKLEKLNSADIVAKNKELSERLIKAREKGKDNPLAIAIEGKLIEANMPMINEFVTRFYDKSKGGEYSEFYSNTLEEVVKLSKTYTPGEGKAEFGAYLRDALFGGGSMGPIGRRGNILDRFEKGKMQSDISIDADGSILQLEGGISSTGSVGPGQSRAGLIVFKERLNMKPEQIKKIEDKIDLENLGEINYGTYEGITLDYTMELVGGIKRADRIKEIEGLVGKTYKENKVEKIHTLETATQRVNEKYSGESTKNLKEKLQWIFEGKSENGHENWKTYYGSMPHGAMLGTGKPRIEGKSTNISDALLNDRMYTTESRTGEKAEASFKKTGQTAGLPVQNKIEIKSKKELADRFGVVLDKNGNVDFAKTKIKAQSKDLRAIDAGFKELDKAIRNQVTREYLERIGNEGVNPELRNDLARNALINQIAGGKSKELFSQDLFHVFGGNIKKREAVRALHEHQRDRAGFIKKYGEEAYHIISDMINHEITNRALEGVGEKSRFTPLLKNSKYGDLFLKHDYAAKNLNDKSKEDGATLEKLRRKFVANNVSWMKLIPGINKNFIDGNLSMMMELSGQHRGVIGKKYSKRKGAHGFKKIKEVLAQEALSEKEGGLPQKVVDMFNSIDYATMRGSYSSGINTAWRKAAAVGGAKGREMLNEYLTKNKGVKELLKFYDAINMTLEHWVHSAKNKEIRDQRLGHVFALKKANSQMGTTGERNLAPGGYFFIPPTGFFNRKVVKDRLKKLMNDGGYINQKGNFTKFTSKNPRNEAETYLFNKLIKFEHLKSSSQQSFESAMMIANRTWSTNGYSKSKNYRGIYGRLADFNMIDYPTVGGKRLDARTSTADIFRFGNNLELAKNIYSVESGLKKSLYQEIMESAYKNQAKNLEKFMSDSKLNKLLEIGREKNKKKKGISIFDFDDTLAKTGSKVVVTMPNGKKFKINATEFAKRDAELTNKGAKYDFSEFNKVIDGKKGPLFDLAMKRQGKFSSKDIFILTARPAEAALAIHKFLKGIGLEIPLENIKGLENGSPKAKAEWVKDKFIEGYNDFYFADDAIKNVKAVKNLLNQLDVKSDVQQALYSRDMSAEFNKILEGATGIGANKVYSKAKAQVRGASKGRFKFWIPPSAEDFVGLIYPTLGKGRTGDAQMAWYKKNLLDPYARAENALTGEKSQMMKDFHALKNEIKSVPKGLRTRIKEGSAKDYTKEQAMRVYIWNKQGMEIPGLSKTDIKNLDGFVKSNKDLMEFADRLIMLHKGDGYAKPSSSWLAGTITTDMFESINTTKRAKHLKEWKENRDIIFSEANLNKYEAAYGKNARAALENILGRMESGQNRKKLGGYFQTLENEVLDWTNNSVGAIMFLNSRSAVLQTISAMNYVNFHDNNPLAAAKAVANQKQYWKDFNKLFNSDYLVQRRDGLKININEAEIVAASEKGGMKGAIAYLLNKGFLFTRYADSFAIASGGSSMYRNRIKSYMKKGLSEKKAEELAFKDFRELSEESQQSSRPDRISAQQASGLGRVVLAFANTPMQYARLQKRAIQDLYNGRGDAKTNLSKIVYYGFVQNLIFNALQQALFAVGFDEDPRDQKQIMDKSGKLINGMLDSQLRGLGYQGAAIATVKNILFKLSEEHSKDRPKYENAAWEAFDFAPPISSKVTKVRSAFRSLDYDLDEMQTEGFHLENPAFGASANLLSAAFNLPVDRVLKKMDNIKDAMDENNETWAKIALLSGWSEWDLGLEDRQLKRLYDELNPKKEDTNIRKRKIRPRSKPRSVKSRKIRIRK
jgi:hypothetical protein